MGRSGNITRGARPVFRTERQPISAGVLDVLVEALERFLVSYHSFEHGNSGYELDRCPFGRCAKLRDACDEIRASLNRIREREQDLRTQLADAGIALPMPTEANREGLSRDAAAAVKLFNEADRELFLHGHGRATLMLGALAALEDEYVRAADVNIRSVSALSSAL